MMTSRREIIKGGCALLCSAAIPGAAAFAATKAAVPDKLAFVHPELRAAATQMLATSGKMPGPSVAALPVLRARNAGFARPRLPTIPVTEQQIDGEAGAPPVTLYIINARADGSRPAIVHMHGGGFFGGAAKSDIRNMQEVAQAIGCVVVTVEYRLAPETSWQGSCADNYAALKWLYANAASLGVDRSRIAVMGESAGGGHAALLAQRARDRDEVPIVAQILTYPMLDDRTGSSRAVPPQMGAIGWSPEFNRFGWRCFLGREPGGKAVPAGAVPARVASVAGLAPAFIGVGSIDLFCDENVHYARRLIEAGIPTELHVVPGAFHGFDRIASETSVAKQFAKAKLDAVRRAFGIAIDA